MYFCIFRFINFDRVRKFYHKLFVAYFEIYKTHLIIAEPVNLDLFLEYLSRIVILVFRSNKLIIAFFYQTGWRIVIPESWYKIWFRQWQSAQGWISDQWFVRDCLWWSRLRFAAFLMTILDCAIGLLSEVYLHRYICIVSLVIRVVQRFSPSITVLSAVQ